MCVTIHADGGELKFVYSNVDCQKVDTDTVPNNAYVLTVTQPYMDYSLLTTWQTGNWSLLLTYGALCKWLSCMYCFLTTYFALTVSKIEINTTLASSDHSVWIGAHLYPLQSCIWDLIGLYNIPLPVISSLTLYTPDCQNIGNHTISGAITSTTPPREDVCSGHETTAS